MKTYLERTMQFPTRVDDGIEMRPFQPEDAEVLIDLITRNRERLDRWMRWTAPVKTLDDARSLIRQFQERLAGGDSYHVGLWVDGQLAGGIAVRGIDRDNGNSEIGYWLGEEYVGKGLVTRSCRLVINDLFQNEGVHRIEIQAVSDNFPSRAVAERLGFTFEGIRRECIWITDAFKDHALYALLDREWEG